MISMALNISTALAASLLAAGNENNPFIAHENKFATGTVATTNGVEQSDGAAANAITGTTYDYWRARANASGNVVLKSSFGGNRNMSFAAISGHNIGTLGGTIAFETSTDDSAWTDCGVGAISPTDDTPIAFYFDVVTAQYWRFRITGLAPSTDIVYASVAWAGTVMTFPRRFYAGFSPVISSTEVQLQSNVSVGGHDLGSIVVSRGSTLECEFSNIPATFIRGNEFSAFLPTFNEGKSVWMAWRPTKYPQDIYYCRRSSSVIRPVNSGPRDLMSLSIEARVFNG